MGQVKGYAICKVKVLRFAGVLLRRTDPARLCCVFGTARWGSVDVLINFRVERFGAVDFLIAEQLRTSQYYLNSNSSIVDD